MLIRKSFSNSSCRIRIIDNLSSTSRRTSGWIDSQSFSTSTSILNPQSYSNPDRNQIRMLLLGSPGSGKGTLSTRLLSQFPSLNNLSAGDALRQHISRGTQIGKEADKVIKGGGLMPDQVMMKLCYAEVKALGDKDWLLDGFPRTVGQAKLLDSALKDAGKPLGLVVYLDVPEKVILNRILERYIHPPSGRVYNLSFNPPKVPGKDDLTGEPLEQRSDDNPETFKKRLISFRKETEPIRSHYEDLSRESQSGGVKCVTLKGVSSDEIWPGLLKEVKERFER